MKTAWCQTVLLYFKQRILNILHFHRIMWREIDLFSQELETKNTSVSWTPCRQTRLFFLEAFNIERNLCNPGPWHDIWVENSLVPFGVSALFINVSCFFCLILVSSSKGSWWLYAYLLWYEYGEQLLRLLVWLRWELSRMFWRPSLISESRWIWA